MKRTLTIRVKWDAKSTLENGHEGMWVAGDDVWAYGTGQTPQEAVTELLESIRDATILGDAYDNWPPKRAYTEWLAQAGRAA